MENITKPLDLGFTVYSKSGCINCTKIKKILLETKHFFLDVDCDEFLIEDRVAFLLFMKEISLTEVGKFPMIFNDGKFIGGYDEAKEYIEKQSVSFDENIDF
jgi:glutaredoxin